MFPSAKTVLARRLLAWVAWIAIAMPAVSLAGELYASVASVNPYLPWQDAIVRDDGVVELGGGDEAVSLHAEDLVLIDFDTEAPIAIYLARSDFELADAVGIVGDHRPRMSKVATLMSGQIAVLYPDVGEPYRGVFAKIVEGIEAKAPGRVSKFPVGNDANVQSIAADLRKQDIRVVIALGRQGLKAAALLGNSMGVVVGGVVSIPDVAASSLAVHSLAPDPAILFQRLKALSPSTNRVFIVYDPRQNDWLVRIAREAAKAYGIELQAYEAQDIKSALRSYQEILTQADARRDAVWLPQDTTTVDDSVILPMVLQESWNRNIPLFSSSVAHVRRGALFSLYPNNVELGRNLAQSAMSLSTVSTGSHVAPLMDVLIAVNVRTATHLGLNLSYKQQQGFDMVFPEP